MAGTTISGGYTIGLTLSTPATENPATISGTGHINVTAASGSALYGTNVAAWSVYNYGTIVGPTRGVFLIAGGTVTNESSGLISGGTRGVDITGAAATVTNTGSIVGGTQQGVRLTGGGSVTNASGGHITGGGAYAAIDIRNGGSVGNAASATITGPVQIYDSAGTVTNGGSINAGNTATDGVQLFAGGSVTNTSGAAIGGVTGVSLTTGTVANAGAIAGSHIGVYLAAGTVSNSGSIAGANYAIQSNGTGSALITNLPGGVLQGGIAVAAGASSAVSVSNGGTITGGTFGISLHDVGSVTNTAGAVILGAKSAPVGTAYAAIYLGSGGAVSNAGSIDGEFGIIAHGNASIANSASATISGVFVSSGVGTLANAGYIGVVSLYDGGTVTNQVSGSIFSTNLGGPTGSTINSGSMINYGTLDNRGGGIALYMSGNGSLSNAASGLITYISMGNDASVSNAGTITDRLDAGYYSFLSNNPGATISSVAITSGTFDNAGVIDGTRGIRGVHFQFGGLVSNASSGTIAGTVGVAMYTGTNAAQYGTVINAGTITGNSGAAVRFPNGHGVLVVDPGARFNGMVDSVTAASSALELGTGSGGTLAGFGTSIVNFGSITFETGAEWTIAGNTSGLSGVISGFAQADTIDLTALSETVQDYSAGTLTLVGDQTVTLQLPGTFTAASFRTAPDAGTGTDIFLACFVAGTRIATDRGHVPVEHLRIGDHALTLGDGGALVPRPVRWIGRRRIDLARHPRPEAARPIRIRRGAFSEGVPDRDLLLSPDHAIYAEGVLIPVRWLVNESSVAPARRMRHVEYFHVELDRHAILLAEGMPAESYLDSGDRSTFENGGVAVELYPDFASRTWESGGCARLVVTGPEMEAVRQRLQRRANRNDRVVRTKAAAAW